MGSVAVIILQYGNADATIDCIKSVEKHNTHPVKYIVVDNCSPDDGRSAERVYRFLYTTFGGDVMAVGDDCKDCGSLPKVTLIRSAVNDGYACGNNKGLSLAYADGDVENVLILNNDILFVEDIIPTLVSDLKSRADGAMVSPLLYKSDLKTIDANCARRAATYGYMLKFNLMILHATKRMTRTRRLDVVPAAGLVPVELISGSCIMVDKGFFESIGSFDSGTFLYYEENILWEKVRRLGRMNYVDTDIKCIHLGAMTIGQRMSRKTMRLTFQSQLYYVRRYMPHGLVKALLLWLSHRWIEFVLTLRHGLLWR